MDYTNLAKLIIKSMATKPEYEMYMPDIESICDIPCSVRVKVWVSEYKGEKSIHIIQAVETNVVRDEELAEYFYFLRVYNGDPTCEDVIKILTQMEKDITLLTYDSLTSSMNLPKTDYEILRDEFRKSVYKNVKHRAVEACSVCYLETHNKTSCGHVVCIPCADKICTKIEEAEGNRGNDLLYPCPICREDTLVETSACGTTPEAYCVKHEVKRVVKCTVDGDGMITSFFNRTPELP